MRKRSYKYFKIKAIERMASRVKPCIEFPHFGATYPDACCIDGYLWDLDSGDNGMVDIGGDDPCPTCNTRSYIQNFLDSEFSITRIYDHMKFLFTRFN